MLERTVSEQQRHLYWHRGKVESETPRKLLLETDELMYWLEECLVQNLRLVPGWIMPRLTYLHRQARPSLPRGLGGGRRPQQVMEVLSKSQAALMELSVRSRKPARIIPLFR